VIGLKVFALKKKKNYPSIPSPPPIKQEAARVIDISASWYSTLPYRKDRGIRVG
jgi:hypothetical protein